MSVLPTFSVRAERGAELWTVPWYILFIFPHYCDQDIRRLSYQSYRVGIQTGMDLTPEGKTPKDGARCLS